jgi:hypothetical protein
MRPSRFIVASASLAFCVLVASTTSSTTNAQPAQQIAAATVSHGIEQQAEPGYDYIALDTDGDRQFDDDDHDNVPDHWFKVAVTFLDRCGAVGLCAFRPPGWGTLICAAAPLYRCLKAYGVIQ